MYSTGGAGGDGLSGGGGDGLSGLSGGGGDGLSGLSGGGGDGLSGLFGGGDGLSGLFGGGDRLGLLGNGVDDTGEGVADGLFGMDALCASLCKFPSCILKLRSSAAEDKQISDQNTTIFLKMRDMFALAQTLDYFSKPVVCLYSLYNKNYKK